MSSRLLAALIGGGPLVCWVAAYWGYRFATRVRSLPPGPATPDLGREPPAVVNLLLHQRHVTEDAAEATLLDLAARRVIELRAPDADPAHTTVHLRHPDPAGLTNYERRVLQRVRDRAVGGVAPLSALVFTDRDDAEKWTDEFGEDVVAEATAHGLTSRRLSLPVALVFGLSALVIPVSIAVALLVLARSVAEGGDRADAYGSALGAALWSLPVLAAAWTATAGLRALRLSAAGRSRARYWLGVRDWLNAHPTFDELPPSAAMVWDRYLAYGAALGGTAATSRVIDLGLGGHRRPWSSYGGRWRRVRVQRLSLWAQQRVSPFAVYSAVVVLLLAPLCFGYVASLLRGPGRLVGIGLAAVGPLVAVYLLIRQIADRGQPMRFTGQVLWVRAMLGADEDKRTASTFRTFAIDDGTSDEIRPWLAMDVVGADVLAGDVVSVTALRWSRRITKLSVLHRPAGC
jgi:hypothetical protein